MRTARTGVIAAVLPGVVMLALFYSLALHMHHSLGGWPTSIGERGFPPALLAHANFTILSFQVLVVLGVFVWPLATLLCAAVPRWRRALPYLVMYMTVCVVCWALTQLAPEPFLYWWRD